ncbi:MAG: DUF559 domain-containing protein [Bacteroidetes bacterium]|nr:DUF559 domain-containing protein [Bacteroidota bacterium]
MSLSYYNKNLKGFARSLRHDSTLSEIRLWSEVLKNSQTGYAFLRQRPIEKYIADFLCRKLKLIIEVDGYSHNFKYEEDLKRDEELLKLGYKTLRFHDSEVMHDLMNVEKTIICEIEKREIELGVGPSPSSPQG